MLVLLGLLFCSTAGAVDLGGLDKWDVTKWSLTDTKILEVKSVYLDYMNYVYAEEPFLLPNVPTSRLDLHLDVEMFNRTLFVENMIHSESDMSQFALVAWNYRLGAHVSDHIDVYLQHESDHLLDTSSIVGPEKYTTVGVRIYFYKQKD